MPRWNYSNWKERFFSKVGCRKWNRDLESFCWEWLGGLQTDGYGSFGMKNESTGKWSNWPAHRVSWLIYYGEIPKYPEFEICHKCDDRKCVNPAHLFVGNHKENISDMYKKNRSYDRNGENNPRAKLTLDDVVNIRNMYKIGITPKTLSELYSVSTTHIHSIVSYRTWKTK